MVGEVGVGGGGVMCGEVMFPVEDDSRKVALRDMTIVLY